jgi:hypothetical protein
VTSRPRVSTTTLNFRDLQDFFNNYEQEKQEEASASESNSKTVLTKLGFKKEDIKTIESAPQATQDELDKLVAALVLTETSYEECSLKAKEIGGAKAVIKRCAKQAKNYDAAKKALVKAVQTELKAKETDEIPPPPPPPSPLVIIPPPPPPAEESSGGGDDGSATTVIIVVVVILVVIGAIVGAVVLVQRRNAALENDIYGNTTYANPVYASSGPGPANGGAGFLAAGAMQEYPPAAPPGGKGAGLVRQESMC